ncbi:MAG: phosphotransferase [Nitrospiraceae bacterium]|nr:phosphotransferase [Nitrospiraceae bacterium]
MPALSFDAVTDYLRNLLGGSVRVISLAEHGRKDLGGDLKSFGYGNPVFIEFEVDGERRRAVLETVSPSSFGHDHFSDRAQSILWEHGAFNSLPRHVPSLASGALLRTGALLSTGQAEEFFLLTEYVEGEGYFKDLDRIRDAGAASEADRDRARALSAYLSEIHHRKKQSPQLYRRRIRDLLGHGECIMGLIDNYPERHAEVAPERLRRIEETCLAWRWKLRPLTHRLCQVHGDFHPWNILFRERTDFTVLDRSRGEWGEPADDTTCLTINYLFSSMQHAGRLEGAFEILYRTFWDTYLEQTNDRDMLSVAPPFLAWRGLVLASPVWYPHLPPGMRGALFRFIENVLAEDRFDYLNVNRYLR